jgi:hypothetical protein
MSEPNGNPSLARAGATLKAATANTNITEACPKSRIAENMQSSDIPALIAAGGSNGQA